MIVKPNFPDHWKTQLLVRVAGHEKAVRCLLRFWAHCQEQKKWKYSKMTPVMLANISGWDGDENAFYSAMSKTFLDVDGDTAEAHEWKLVNARLLHNWKSGKKGGRPRNPRETQGLADETLGEPIEKIDGVDKIDEIREEGKKGALHFPVSFSNATKMKFEEWIVTRKAMGKKPKSWPGMFQEQLDWLARFSDSDAFEIVSASKRNNWQGLFELKNNGAKPIAPMKKLPAYE